MILSVNLVQVAAGIGVTGIFVRGSEWMVSRGGALGGRESGKSENVIILLFVWKSRSRKRPHRVWRGKTFKFFTFFSLFNHSLFF